MKRQALLLACVVLLLITAFAWNSSASGEKDLDGVKIATLVNEMNGVNAAKLEAMVAIPPKPNTLPEPGVDVMRVRLVENYSVAGIGDDSVELNGWIAVAHGKPSTNDWNTAVTETRFVAMDLKGESSVFGPVHVTFDPDHPAVGEVGRLGTALPEKALMVLAAANRENRQAGSRQQSSRSKQPAGKQPAAKQPTADKATTAPSTSTTRAIDDSDPCADGSSCIICRAPVSVAVAMPNLGLNMKTKVPATWFSVVNTIPPVGHTASVTVDPVALVTSDGREVGVLNSGRVLFRETVRHVGLSHDVDVTTRVASQPAPARSAAAIKK
jgi:hypothetical protein